MKRRRKHFKINTQGKSYTIKDSPFYNLKNTNKLYELLHSTIDEIESLKVDAGNYAVFNQVNGTKKRLIEHPSERLDKIHTRIASLLCRINLPNYLHSGVKGRSHITNAKEHLGVVNILTTDVKSFFPSTKREKVFNLFYSIFKCSPKVANLIADLCTYECHIPTGSRISMPLAFWANRNMFDELNVMAESHAIKMTVYVDDITFSGNKVNRLFKSTVNKIIKKHEHIMHPTKTILYRKNEIKLVTGVIISSDNICIQNKQHKLIYQDIEQWKLSSVIPKTLNDRLLGRLNALSIIDPKLKDKARSIKNINK